MVQNIVFESFFRGKGQASSPDNGNKVKD